MCAKMLCIFAHYCGALADVKASGFLITGKHVLVILQSKITHNCVTFTNKKANALLFFRLLMVLAIFA